VHRLLVLGVLVNGIELVLQRLDVPVLIVELLLELEHLGAELLAEERRRRRSVAVQQGSRTVGLGE